MKNSSSKHTYQTFKAYKSSLWNKYKKSVEELTYVVDYIAFFSRTTPVGQLKSFYSRKFNLKQIRGKLSIIVLQEKIKYHIYKNNDGKKERYWTPI